MKKKKNVLNLEHTPKSIEIENIIENIIEIENIIFSCIVRKTQVPFGMAIINYSQTSVSPHNRASEHPEWYKTRK